MLAEGRKKRNWRERIFAADSQEVASRNFGWVKTGCEWAFKISGWLTALGALDFGYKKTGSLYFFVPYWILYSALACFVFFSVGQIRFKRDVDRRWPLFGNFVRLVATACALGAASSLIGGAVEVFSDFQDKQRSVVQPSNLPQLEE